MRSKGLRMTHGQLKGQLLRVPDSIRPTSAKVRTALMNSWQYRLPKARLLDVTSSGDHEACGADT